MIEDLTMLANQSTADAEAAKKSKDEADKAAAGEVMPPKHQEESPDTGQDAEADRLARRGQDPPANDSPE